MAYAPLPKLVPIGSPRVTSEEITKVMFPEVLQLEPVKRLLNQPNIIIKPVKIDPEDADAESPRAKGKIKKKRPKPDISVSLIDSLLAEEPQYLPSKTNGDSGISLHPIEHVTKKCGHSEACENIICDVEIHQDVDEYGSNPLLASDVTESDENAPVSKHCENPHCDALSIDHNRCRRLKIELNSIDKTAVCDICRISLKNRKTRIYHRNCRRKNEYRHNQASGAQILKDRMRECEIQMMTALRMKRNEYIDPLDAYENAIESLKNNSELIVIPKTPDASDHSFITIDTASDPSDMPFIFPHPTQTIYIDDDNNITLGTSSDFQEEFESSIPNGYFENFDEQNQYIVAAMPQTAITYPLNTNEFVFQDSATPGSPNPILMPVRVVPIANFKTQPSILHQKQGPAKFCIIADDSVPMQPIVNVQTITPIQTLTVQSSNASNPISVMPNPGKAIKHDGDGAKVGIKKLSSRNSKHRSKHWKKKKGDKKPFQCKICSKRFTTDWYFKVHVAKHKGGKKAKCEICETVFKNDSDLKNHTSTEHKDKVQDNVYDEQDSLEIIEDEQESFIWENCETTYETYDDAENNSYLEINGNFCDVEIQDDDVIDVEMERIVDNEDLEILTTKVNGVMKTKNETHQNDKKKAGRRKSKQICRVDDEISEEPNLHFSAEEKRKKKRKDLGLIVPSVLLE